MNEQNPFNAIAAVASIADPVRRALFDLVSRGTEPVGRDEAASALEIPRPTAAFHLDRLVASGLLVVDFQRRTGRTGPGAGRPAKLYRTARVEVGVSVPERHYDLAAELLSSAIEESDRTAEPIRQALVRVSTQRGRALRRAAGSFAAVLNDTGYEPADDEAGGQVLTNCPFHQLALSHTATICEANFALLRGAAENEAQVGFEPAEGRCCVRIVSKSPPA